MNVAFDIQKGILQAEVALSDYFTSQHDTNNRVDIKFRKYDNCLW